MVFRLLAFVVSIAAPLSAATAGDRQPVAAVARTPAALRILVDPATRNAAATGPADGNEVRRADDGLFYVDADVNGTIVHFLIDTGASAIVLTPDDARRAGVTVGTDAGSRAETANGATTFRRVTLGRLAVGTLANRAVPAVVAGDGLAVSLLGQSWLQQLASMTVEGDRMVLR